MNPTQEQVNEYLDRLKESGVVNMFGAGEYLMSGMGLDYDTARAMLGEWMRSYAERSR